MDRCESLLAGGVFNTDLVTKSDEVRTSFERFWFSKSAKEAEAAFNSGVRFPLPKVPGLLVDGHLDGKKFDQWKQTVADKYSG